jgi:hypothetical protein
LSPEPSSEKETEEDFYRNSDEEKNASKITYESLKDRIKKDVTKLSRRLLGND